MTRETFKIAIIVARYGLDAIGGAETLARGFAEEAVKRGWSLEVWTSCALDPFEWRNDFSPGIEIINGVTVRRFFVSRGDRERFEELGDQLRIQHSLPIADQYGWIKSGPQSLTLYEYVALNAASFDAIVVLPYLNPIAYQAAWLAPQKTILWPCLHNEVYAYLEPFRLLAESVRGLIFNSPEESELALETIRWRPLKSAVTGAGVNIEEQVISENTQENRPLLYVGRLEHAKNLSLFFDYAGRYYEEDNEFSCILVGTGPLKPPPTPPFQLTGFISDREKAQLTRSSLALCQPSENESFSLAIMESWLAGRPVLVSESCAVTAGHVARSKGGLWFRSYGDFAGAVRWLKNRPDQANQMGNNGRQYVEQNYTWEKVVDRISAIFGKWLDN